MTNEQRLGYIQKYGINYVMSNQDERYEYGSYQATNNPDIRIEYKFSLSEFNKERI